MEDTVKVDRYPSPDVYKAARNRKRTPQERVEAIEVLGQSPRPESLGALVRVVSGEDGMGEVAEAALKQIEGFGKITSLLADPSEGIEISDYQEVVGEMKKFLPRADEQVRRRLEMVIENLESAINK